MLADKQVPVLNLTESNITSQADLQDAFQSICLCSQGREGSTKDKTQSDYLSDSESSEDKVNPHLRTSQEERVYGTIKGSAQATQVALSHTTTQSNPMVERGWPKQPKIKKLFQRAGIGQNHTDKRKG